jgi:hypothetical protein
MPVFRVNAAQRIVVKMVRLVLKGNCADRGQCREFIPLRKSDVNHIGALQ